MFINYITKRALIVFVFCLFCCCMGNMQAIGQIFPYPSYSQPFLPLISNPYINAYSWTNPYSLLNTAFPYSGTNPYSLLNTAFPSLNSLTPLGISPFYPQASTAGALIPFAGLYANPLAPPIYNVAAVNYIAAATIPANVAGSWSGAWVSTLLVGGVITGELSMTLAQVDVDVTGTVAFFLNKILKFGSDVAGVVDGNTLTLTSTIVPSLLGIKSFDVTISATVNGLSMDGTYLVINNVTGVIAEQGTFTATRL